MQDVKIHDKVFTVMIEAKQINERIKTLADSINTEYRDKKPLFLGVLNGAFLFAADLFKEINIECEISFVKVSSYAGTESSGAVKNLIGISHSIKDRHVIVLEDIVDTGDTARYIIEELKRHETASIKFATLLFKPKALKHHFRPDYSCFEIDPAFVVGFGLDYDGLGRNLNDIYVLKNNG